MTVGKTVVISQPMFFPWVGLFEQVRLADTYVHYDDVQLPQGRSFMSRVQVKTPTGDQWLTVPIRRTDPEQLIKNTQLDDSQDWRARHAKFLLHNFARAPFREDMLEIVHSVYATPVSSLAELNQLAIEKIADYFGFRPVFVRSSQLGVPGASSERLLKLVSHVEGSIYLTGHGARNYLDHALFEQRGIHVEYMDYRKNPYPQLHGAFTPYVSILDLIANQGRGGREVICSGTIPWKEFIK